MRRGERLSERTSNLTEARLEGDGKRGKARDKLRPLIIASDDFLIETYWLGS
jgi:hypothetical protein